ncbi:hypothetical protein ACOMHN_009669 [Nucella lapillus]
MLPSGFKKDSRLWLHKNPKPRADDVDKTVILRRFLDSGRSFSDNAHCCYFMDTQGRKFKKDSRAWLHKSSLKNHLVQRTRRKAGPLRHVVTTGHCCRNLEFARSYTEVRTSLQKRKCATFHPNEGDIFTNDTGLRQVLGKKRVNATTTHGVGQQLNRRPLLRSLSDEGIHDEGHTLRLGHSAESYLPLHNNRELWRDASASTITSDTSSSSANSKTSMDMCGPTSCQDVYNNNGKDDNPMFPDPLLAAVTDKLRGCQSAISSSDGSLGVENAQLKMMSLCASPPRSLCSEGSMCGENWKSGDVDM